jgi:hypothetical protein
MLSSQTMNTKNVNFSIRANNNLTDGRDNRSVIDRSMDEFIFNDDFGIK